MEEAHVFHDRSPLSDAFKASSVGAVVGLVTSAVQNSLQKHHSGAMGVFTRTGSTIALFTLVGGAFAYADATAANMRRKDDGWNGAVGGCAAGLVVGAASRSIPMIGGSCVGLGGIVGTFQAAGNTMLNEKLIKPQPVEKLDPSSPLLGTTQERRSRFFKKAQQDQDQDQE
ncbi:hypothetical protein MYAM1_002185 [Malassezia yamatoensis]|uniref:NADH dehydrogenase [ubiquinone] 1 alpha subcomplex subunit 11 n=1 Tax=Malassezia yamatoensis TaxID=253288 RepID=A0AAJ5YVF6_9BASI|nr:hypothetical protein MYAM1_002185 [Malassezia yamatoensis]